MITRPLEITEYQKIIDLFYSGFRTEEGRVFRGNPKIALSLQLQASLGLRIGDVLELQVDRFKNGKMTVTEEKTGKLQYRDINPNVYCFITDYIREKDLKQTDKIFNMTVRAVQKQLKLVTDYLGFDHISTHSFRKMYATYAYETNNHDIHLVKELLNHSSVVTTQRYIRVTQDAINKASAKIDFISR